MLEIGKHIIGLSGGQRLLICSLTTEFKTLPCSINDLCHNCVIKGLIIHSTKNNQAKLTSYGDIVRKALEAEMKE